MITGICFLFLAGITLLALPSLSAGNIFFEAIVVSIQFSQYVGKPFGFKDQDDQIGFFHPNLGKIL